MLSADNLPQIPICNLTSDGRHGFVIGLAGWSGSGKTTLAEKLITKLSGRGIDVATIKHAHHHFDADIPGKDSYRHRHAGASQVLVSSAVRSVLFSEHNEGGDRPLAELLASLRPCDIVIVEGFKQEPIPKIEVSRIATDKPLLYPDDKWIVGIASDTGAPDGSGPYHLDLNNPETIADFICALATQNASMATSA